MLRQDKSDFCLEDGCRSENEGWTDEHLIGLVDLRSGTASFTRNHEIIVNILVLDIDRKGLEIPADSHNRIS